MAEIKPEIIFCISAWSCWSQHKIATEYSRSISAGTNPDISIIPPLLRRRLNLLGRAAASQSLELLNEHNQVAMVYCSRYGDSERTLSVLKELVAAEPVSPMKFSLTVHNAVAGVLTIQTGSTAAVSSIAAGDESLIPTLLEAWGMLRDQHAYVLCLICDVPLPDIYRSSDLTSAFACAFLLSQHEGKKFTLSRAAEQCTIDTTLPQALVLSKFLDSEAAEFFIAHHGSHWRLRRYSA